MAGYRPKSLNELNDMYDKTITAEKAIIKASMQLHDATESIAPAAVQPTAEELPKEECKTVEALSSEVDSLINRFKSEITASSAKPAEAPSVKKDIPTAEPPKKISFEKDIPPAHESVISQQFPSASPAKAKPLYELEIPGEVAQKAASKSDERTELFEDYMKIMNDDDDDFFSNRESFRKKSKKKKHKKSFFTRHEPSEEGFVNGEEPSEEKTENAEETTQEAASLNDSKDALPVREVIYSPEASALENEGLQIEFSASAEQPSAEYEEEFSDFVQQEYDEIVSENTEFTENAEDHNEVRDEHTVEAHPDFDIGEGRNDELPPIPDELADTTYDEFMNSDDIYSFDPNKSNTIPDYARESFTADGIDDTEYEETGEEEFSEEEYPMPKNRKGVLAGRVILSILLSLLCVVAVAVSGINLVLGVNSGRAVFGDKYIFTAESDYTGADILNGDLIITENRYAEDGEVFAYINYTRQCFMFGKRNGSIVNDSSDVLFIAENNGERVLVLRDDTRGVVEKIYPGVGTFVGMCTDYFIPVMAVILIAGLVIVLLIAFVFKDKEKAYKKMMKKMIKKGVISADEESDYVYTEENDTEDLFSTIE